MVTVDGKEWPFSAKGVASPAGLYEGRGNVDGVAARVGWIVEEQRLRHRASSRRAARAGARRRRSTRPTPARP